MLETIALVVSSIALVAAVMALPGFEPLRLTAVLIALGCGQIYIAIAAFFVFLAIESGTNLRNVRLDRMMSWNFLLLAGILVTTAVAPSNSRTFMELMQLALYVVLFLLVLSYIHSGERLQTMLQACVASAIGVTIIAIFSVLAGFQSAPNIFLARGANEGAVFLSLIGVIPATTLFVRSRNPVYLAIAVGLIYPQLLATSRGSMMVSVLALLTCGFFLFSSLLVRAILIAGGIYVLVANLPLLSGLYYGQLNFSARERLALFEHGTWLWEQSPIRGWGWGSTTDLAQQAPRTELVYPHFHNSYVQLLVESGVVGIAMIGTFVYFYVSRALLVARKARQQAVSMLVVSTGIGLAVSGFFDAMLYGADRAVQVILLVALAARASNLQIMAKAASPQPPPPRAALERIA